MKIGLFGGAFDPPHIGHVNTATEAVSRLELDRLIVMPTAVSPHKKNPDVSAQMRLEMARLAFADIKNCEVSDLEISRGGISYTSDTLEALSKMYPDALFFLIVGTDMFMSFDTWHEPQKIASLAEIAVFQRDNFEISHILEQAKMLESKYGAKTVIVKNRIVPASSTKVRGGDEESVPQSVKEYIHRHNLYLIPRIEAYIKENISEKRARHIFGVRDTAVHLAERYGTDVKKAEIAALLHDCTKEWENSAHKEYAAKHGVPLRDIYPRDYKLFHAVTGAIFAAEHFGITDSEIINAVKYHTTGRAHMSMTEKIVFIADVIEPNRTYAEVDMLRKLTEKDIDSACKWYCEWEIARLSANGAVPADDTTEAYSYFAKRSDSGESVK